MNTDRANNTLPAPPALFFALKRFARILPLTKYGKYLDCLEDNYSACESIEIEENERVHMVPDLMCNKSQGGGQYNKYDSEVCECAGIQDGESYQPFINWEI